MGWGDDVESSEEEDSTEEEEPAFGVQFEKAILGTGEPGDISELQLNQNLDEVEDEEVLRQAWLQFGGEKRNLVENRLESLGVDLPGDGEGEEESSDADGDDSDHSEDSEETEDDSSDNSWGGSTEDDEEDGESPDDSEAAQPSIESVEDMEEESDEESSQSEESADSGGSGNGPPVPASAVGPDELMDRDRRWKIMTWGPPKLFKTHFAYTMPEPIAYIDTEGKADDILSKFSGKEIQFWRPDEMTAKPDTKFRRVKKALDEALEWLDWWYENEGKIGTIVVDSMSLVWEWAQRHHKLENYPLKDAEEVSLSSNFQSSQESDWAVIKEYHNGEFRERITDSRYHFYWTAMQRVSFEETFEDEDNRQIYEPKGEPNNDHKVDTIIRARKDKERGKVGDLVGSNFTDNVFVGLKKPTYPKVQKAINEIMAAEGSDDSVDRSELAKSVGAEAIIDYDPQKYTN